MANAQAVCECTIPNGGMCARHKVDKSARWVALCQAGGKYWEAWERGDGPGQWDPTKPSRGLGDTIARVTRAMGIKKPCDECKERQYKANRLWPFKGRWTDDEIRAYMQRDPAAGREPLPEITRRNILFHVYAAGKWRWHVERLVGAMDQFNGRRIVAIAVDGKTESTEIVRAAFGSKQHSIEFIEAPNDAQLREAKSFPRLLGEVASTHPYEATFYAHTKGNSTTKNSTGAELWARTMYRVLLDNPDRTCEVLRYWPATGINVIHWHETRKSPYPSKLHHGDWMFAGTFFWFRHDAIFTRDWNNVPADRYGAEAWLSGVLPFGSGWSAYQTWPETRYPTPSPYDCRLYLDEVCQ